jgi:xylan 1,4-beta-xylosidase
MVIAARSRSVNGPWENCPHNPILRTKSDAEQWWSRGHATVVEGPGGRWHLVYQGYKNGYRTLGRQTLLESIEWVADGWPQALVGDLSRPLSMPRRAAPCTGPHDCSPLTQMVGDRAYEISVEMELTGDVQGGLLLFFNDRLFFGMGYGA